MSWERDLQQALEELKKRSVNCFVAKVTEVFKTDGHCTVSDDEIEYTKVRLSAIIDGNEQKQFIFPKKGSTVLVEPINEDIKQLYVAKYSEVESVAGKIGSTEYLIDNNGYRLNREGEKLKEVLNDWMDKFGELCDALNAVVVAQGVGPNVPQITQIKNSLTITIKQRLNKILQE